MYDYDRVCALMHFCNRNSDHPTVIYQFEYENNWNIRSFWLAQQTEGVRQMRPGEEMAQLCVQALIQTVRFQIPFSTPKSRPSVDHFC